MEKEKIAEYLQQQKFNFVAGNWVKWNKGTTIQVNFTSDKNSNFVTIRKIGKSTSQYKLKIENLTFKKLKKWVKLPKIKKMEFNIKPRDTIASLTKEVEERGLWKL